MMSIIYVFWMYVILFAVIGALRGWVKELIVACSMITALAANALMRQYLPPLEPNAMDIKNVELFWIRTIVLLALTFFGYQTVGIVPHLASKAKRESLVEGFLGLIVGAINGYLMVGTILSYYITDAEYPYPDVIGRLQRQLSYLCSNNDDVHAAALAGDSLGLLRAHSLLDLYPCRIHLNRN